MIFSLIKPLIFSIDPEVAHDLAIKSLKTKILPDKLFYVEKEEMLETKLFNRKIKNPIGLAAGFDKSAEVYNPLYRLGFGFVEVGTITPRRQLGNPKPRVFRLEKDNALINRLGFNNHGSDEVIKRISKDKPKGFLGVNIGPNRDTKNKIEDFTLCFSKLHKFADYITINISSPNTKGLRDFHEENSLEKLFKNLSNLRKLQNTKVPLVIKISPDINEQNINSISELVLKYEIDGLIVSNTTDKNRQNLTDKNKIEEGGLSGLPLKDLSTNLIQKFKKNLKNKVFIIGVGGVDSGKSAFEKITAGASAVQLYTGMIYKGPTIVKDIKKELIEILKKEKISHISKAIGINS